MKVYCAIFVNAGNRAFLYNDEDLGLTAITTKLHFTEEEAVNELIDILYKKGGVFNGCNPAYGEKIKIKDIKLFFNGSIEKMQTDFPDPESWTPSAPNGSGFKFELKTFDINLCFE